MVVTTGILGLDRLIGGLLPGDNVIFAGDQGSQLLLERVLEKWFRSAAHSATRAKLILVVSEGDPDGWKHKWCQLKLDVEVIDARARRPLGEPRALSQFIIDMVYRTPRGTQVFVGFESFGIFVQRWGSVQASKFYVTLCPVLFELRVYAYWLVTGSSSRSEFLSKISGVGQVVIEVAQEHVRVLKADGRDVTSLEHFGLVKISQDGEVIVQVDEVRGALSSGLRRIREEFGLSQGALAQLAGISPSAVSQVEAGHRSLSLSTILQISRSLGVGLDDVVRQQVPSYLIVRSGLEIQPTNSGLLINYGSDGRRVYSIALDPGQRFDISIRATWVFCIVLKGVARCKVDRNEPLLREREILIVKNEVLHQVEAVGHEGLLAFVISAN
ncbi:MAG: helix-turn-helix domain-containing protein [Ferrimicrobium acidiphilum]